MGFGNQNLATGGAKPTFVIQGNQNQQNPYIGVHNGGPNAWAINHANDYGLGNPQMNSPANNQVPFGQLAGGTGYNPNLHVAQQNSGNMNSPQMQAIFGPQGNNTVPGVNGMGGGGMGAGGISGLISQQQAENNKARAQQEALWKELKGYMQGIPGQYNNSAITKGSQALTQKFLNDPEALNDQAFNSIKNSTMNQITAQKDNQLAQQRGILAASGNDDSATLAAGTERANLGALAAGANANNQLGVTRANQRNQDYMNAAGLGQRQSAQDIGVPMQVGQSLLASMPQYRPDDLSGLIALMQNQNNHDDLMGAIGGGAMTGGQNFQDPGQTAMKNVGGHGGGGTTSVGYDWSGYQNTPMWAM